MPKTPADTLARSSTATDTLAKKSTEANVISGGHLVAKALIRHE